MVIKIDSASDSSTVAHAVSRYFNLYHIEINKQPDSYTNYGKDLESALKSLCYGYGNLTDKTISYIGEIPVNNILYELACFDFEEEELLNTLLEKTKEKYFVLSSDYESCFAIIDALMEIIREQPVKLITTQEKDTLVYTRKYPGMVKFIGEFK